MKAIIAALLASGVTFAAQPATAYQTETDPQTQHRKRVGLARWHREEVQRERLAAEAAPIVDEVVSVPVVSGGVDWDAIAECESGGDWHTNSTYDGGLQFHPDTWIAAGGGRFAPYAYLASRIEQIATAERWVEMTGCVHCSSGWPNCGRYA